MRNNKLTLHNLLRYTNSLNKVLVVFVESSSPSCVEYVENLKIKKDFNYIIVNASQNPKLVKHFNVLAYPTNLLFEQGKLVKQEVGILAI